MSSSHSSAVDNLHRNASESTFSSGRAASQSVQSVWHTHHRRSNAQAAQTAAAQYKASLTDLWSASGAGCYTEEHASILYPLISHFVELVHQKLSTSGNAAVLDVASGGGQPACSVARALPGCQIVATDLAPGMVHEARRRAELYKLTNFRCASTAAHVTMRIVRLCAAVLHAMIDAKTKIWLLDEVHSHLQGCCGRRGAAAHVPVKQLWRGHLPGGIDVLPRPREVCKASAVARRSDEASVTDHFGSVSC